jgi:uncharacterized protein (DUF305 family)
MKRVCIFMLFLLLASGFGLSACSNSDNVVAGPEPNSDERRMNLTADDRTFIEYLAGMHAGEIQMAELAKQKSSREDIKDYADQVISSHKDAQENLSDETGESVKSAQASDDTKSHVAYLSSLQGAQFDSEFIALMIADHKDAAGTFRNPFLPVQNSELRGYLNDNVSSLEDNLRAAEKLQK